MNKQKRANRLTSGPGNKRVANPKIANLISSKVLSFHLPGSPFGFSICSCHPLEQLPRFGVFFHTVIIFFVCGISHLGRKQCSFFPSEALLSFGASFNHFGPVSELVSACSAVFHSFFVCSCIHLFVFRL